jgi:hypothetical protein
MHQSFGMCDGVHGERECAEQTRCQPVTFHLETLLRRSETTARKWLLRTTT